MAQRWDSQLYDSKLRFVTRYGEELLDLLGPQPGERILDVGCGTGHLTAKIAAGGATVVGLDSSPDMLAEARQTYPGVEFVEGRVEAFAWDAPFDAVFSNAALHWVVEADAAARCIYGALRPGGRFVAEFGGYRNISRVVDVTRQAIRDVLARDIGHAWYFPSIGQYAAVLEAAGLETEAAWNFDRWSAMDNGGTLIDWIRMFGRGLMPGLDDGEMRQVAEAVQDRLRGELLRDGVWHVDYRRLRIVARRPG